MRFSLKLGLIILISISFSGCKTNKDQQQTESNEAISKNTISYPTFVADSAYYYVEKQVSFGPRVPGSSAHKKCGDWLVSKFKALNLKVVEQNFTATIYDGKRIASKNIIASYKPESSKRILLAAHWDSRPFGDKDPSNKNTPIAGANDGGSGVAVLLELARIITQDSSKLDFGIDFVLFDTEDWGAPVNYTKDVPGNYGGYCIGSEYWSKNPHVPNYSAFYGILLDMVGAPNATFRHEQVSMQVGPSIIRNIWQTASQLGFGQMFINESGGGLTDDHVPVIENLKIPMVDIIDLKLDNNTFFKDHHTMGDNMNAIDKNTLKAVGQTLLHVLYNESNVMQ